MSRYTGLTFAKLRIANLRRLRTTKKYERCLKWTLSDWFLAITGELGEAANVAKKINRGDMTLDQGRTELAKELADVQIYLDLLAAEAGIDLGRATITKFNEVSERVSSPVRFIAGSSGQPKVSK